MDTWDRSHQWVIYRTRHDLRRVSVRFVQSVPSVIELAALRSCFAQFRDLSPSEIKAAVVDSVVLVGVFAGREVWALKEKGIPAHLRLIVEDASVDSYLPFDKT